MPMGILGAAWVSRSSTEEGKGDLHAEAGLDRGPSVYLLPEREEDDEDGRPPEVGQEGDSEEDREVREEPCARRTGRRRC